MQIDQAALTGESLPAKKFTNDVAFSGSAVKQGERHCVVYATGVNTFFGRAAALISGTNNVPNLQIVMNNIGAVCLVTIGVWVVIQLAVQFGHYGHACVGGEGEWRLPAAAFVFLRIPHIHCTDCMTHKRSVGSLCPQCATPTFIQYQHCHCCLLVL